MKSSIHKLSAGLLLAGLTLAATAPATAQEYTFTTLAGLAGSRGSADGTGSAARFWFPTGVAVDSAGNVYVGDSYNYTIRKVTPGGMVTTLAGLAGSSGSADGTGSAARFYGSHGVAVDGAGNVYVADGVNMTIRKVTPGGVVTTLAGLAGSYGSADGTGSAARFYYPFGVAVDSAGNVYVADTYNSTIRKVTPGGVVTTLAGRAGSSGSADGTGSAARFSSPYGVAVDSADNVYVADTQNNTIRKVTPGGAVTTLGGRFYGPRGVAVDGADNVYVADSGNHTIRKVTLGGVVTTLAGLAGSYGSADGTGSAARFSSPYGVAVDSAGNVFVADRVNHTIRKGIHAGPPPAIVQQPLTQTAEIGSVAGFRVGLTNAGPGTVCQWYFNGTALAGATNASLNLASILPAQAGTYTLVVTSAFYASVTSAPAMLSVIPAIQKRPLVVLSLTGDAGSLLHLEYANALAPSPTWQSLGTLDLTNPPQLYYDRSAPLPSSRFYRAWQANTPSMRPTLGLAQATELMLTGLPGSSVRVDWINQFGPTDAWVPLAAVTLTSASQPYVDLTMFRQPPRLYRLVLIAAPPPAIVQQPLTQTAEIGSTPGFRVWLTNVVPGTACQWYFNGTTPLPGATNTSLQLSDAQAAQIGTYTVVVTNIYGAVTSAPALLNVIPAVPRRTVTALSLTGEAGSFLHVEFADALAPGLTWQALGTLALTNPPQLYVDLSDPRPSSRFYRAWQANTPSVRPTLGLGLATELMLTGLPGSTVRVDWINQFGPTDAWVTLATVTLTAASQPYVDLTMFRQPPRLYRLVPVP